MGPTELDKAREAEEAAYQAVLDAAAAVKAAEENLRKANERHRAAMKRTLEVQYAS